jgi:hypothetical protein
MSQIGRRRFFVATGAFLAAPVVAKAQPMAKRARIGVITFGVEPSSRPLEEFRQALREHGYVEGNNITLEYRFAKGRVEPLQRLRLNWLASRLTSSSLKARRRPWRSSAQRRAYPL